MNDKKQPVKIIPSDAKILLDDWDTLTRIIRQVAIPAHKHADAGSELLDDATINDAIRGPYRPFLACKLKAFAKLCSMRMLITSIDNDALQEDKKNIQKSSHPLAKYVSKTTISDVDKRQKQLDEITNEHFSEWQAQIKHWLDLLINSLAKNKVPLSSLETEELAELMPVSELFARFENLNLELPKIKELNFSNYFKLKTELVARNSLARRQLPHTEKELDAVTKDLKNVFSEIHKMEAALIKQQEAPTLKIADFS